MSKTTWNRARRAIVAWCAVAAIVCSGSASAAPASYITETDDFDDVADVVMDYADEFGPERVLLVLDIDNTLLAMKQPLGSDQWFEWQRYLIAHEPRSPHAVADSFPGLLEAQGLLYNLGRMRPPQRDLPVLMARLQGRGIHTLVLTARGDEFRVATERELRRNGYDFAITALPVRGVPNGKYLPYDLDAPEADGLTTKDVDRLGLEEPRPISYANGVMMTAGQNKGAMLLTVLHRAEADIEVIVFVDDIMRHVAFVFSAVAGRSKQVAAFHYTREDAQVKSFQYGDKTDVTRRWRKLDRVLQEVFE